jgi:GAF domain-containing protein
MGQGLTEYIIRTRQSLVIPENVSDWLDNQGIANIGAPAQSWIGAPILFGDEALGVIALQSFETPHLFNEHHLELLNAVASQTASALANARLFQQVQMRARREELLRQITAEVRRSIDMETIMRTAVQEVGQALGRRAFIYLGDEPQPLTSDKEA